jgi:hypothetical protein
MKLEAKDLRVGNLLQKDDGFIYSVRRLTIGDDDILVNEQPSLLTLNYNLQPIPLTEEWLDRLPKEEFDFVGLGIRVICVKFPAIQYEFSENKIWVYFKDETINIVDYVHEWQNIHHFLTREELQLNQTT